MSLRNKKNAVIFYYKKYGLFKTIKKIISALYNRIVNKKNLLSQNEKYQEWIKNNEPTTAELEEEKNVKFNINPKFSIVVPMYNTDLLYFKQLVDCILSQTYENWELCLADGSKKLNPEIEKIIGDDIRIKYKFLDQNKGISGNSNEALKMATGDYIMLVDHDDLIPINCLYELTKAINENKDVEFIYTDEDKIEGDTNRRYDPHFKPDFAIDTLRSNNYITHLAVFKKELMEKLEGFRSKYDGAQDFDIIIRAIENTDKIVHIPKILYHWRVHPQSTAMLADAKPYAYEAGIKVIKDHLERQNLKATVTHGGDIKGVYEVEYEVNDNPSVSIIIPNKDNIKLLKRCINSILEKTTYHNYEIVVVENNSTKKSTSKYYKKLKENKKIRIIKYRQKGFNYSKIINYAVKECKTDFILQLNNDTKILTPNWLEKLIGFATREEIGAVGARLYYKDKSIQHAGIGLGILGLAANLFTETPKNMHAYYARECTTRNVSAVTGACLFARREIYEQVGYMDENLAVAFNDVDFCLKIRKAGYLIVYNPYVELMHYESKTRGYENTKAKKERFEKECNYFKEKWKEELKKDIYGNINFSNKNAQYTIRTDKIY